MVNRAYKSGFMLVHSIWIFFGSILACTILVYNLFTNEAIGSLRGFLVSMAVVTAILGIIQVRHLRWYLRGKEVVEVENDFLLIKYFINNQKPLRIIKLSISEIASITISQDPETHQFINFILPTNGILLNPKKGRLIIKTIYDRSYRIGQDASSKSIVRSEIYFYLNDKFERKNE